MVGGLATKTTGIVLDVARQLGGAMPGVVTLHDHSRFGNHGAMTNVTWEQIPPFGLWVMSFNGTTSLVDCGNDASLDITDTITLETWLSWAYSGAEHGDIFSKGNSNVNRCQLSISYNRLVFIWSNYALADSDFAVDIGTDVWRHLIAIHTQEVANNHRIYLDGEEVVSVTNAKVFAGGAHTQMIGRQAHAPTEYFGGLLAFLHIYTYALTPGLVLQRFEATRRLFGV